MSIGIFLFVVNIDYSVSLGVMGYLARTLGISPHTQPAKYGELVGYLCIVPVFFSIFVFLIAGCKAKTLMKKEQAKETPRIYKKAETSFFRQRGGVARFGEIDFDLDEVFEDVIFSKQ